MGYAEDTRHEDWTDFIKHDLSVLLLVFVNPDVIKIK